MKFYLWHIQFYGNDSVDEYYQLEVEKIVICQRHNWE